MYRTAILFIAFHSCCAEHKKCFVYEGNAARHCPRERKVAVYVETANEKHLNGIAALHLLNLIWVHLA